MSWTEIVFWLFARLRPLLWYSHRLARILEVAVFCLKDETSLLWLMDNPEGRADFESKLADGEHVLDIVIGLRASELLGRRPMPPHERLGVSPRARIHLPCSLDRLAARLARLVRRFADVERLARLRASRLRRDLAAADPLGRIEHRPLDTQSGPLLVLVLVSKFFRARLVSACVSPAAPAAPAGLRIRAPP